MGFGDREDRNAVDDLEDAATVLMTGPSAQAMLEELAALYDRALPDPVGAHRDGEDAGYLLLDAGNATPARSGPRQRAPSAITVLRGVVQLTAGGLAAVLCVWMAWMVLG